MPHFSDDAESWLEDGARYVEDPDRGPETVSAPVRFDASLPPFHQLATLAPVRFAAVLPPERFDPNGGIR